MLFKQQSKSAKYWATFGSHCTCVMAPNHNLWICKGNSQIPIFQLCNSCDTLRFLWLCVIIHLKSHKLQHPLITQYMSHIVYPYHIHTIVMKLPGHNISILHGELVRIISGLVLSDSQDDSTMIYTDHLNSTRLIDDSWASANIDTCLQHMNGHSYYKWILHLLGSQWANILYMKGHSAESSTPSLLNLSTDYYAPKSQHIHPYLYHAPFSTFFMDCFTFSLQLMAGLSLTYGPSLIACSQPKVLMNWSLVMAFASLYLSMTPPLHLLILTYIPCHAIQHLFSFTHILGNSPQCCISTPNIRSTPINVVSAALTFLRTITTSLSSAHFLLNCAQPVSQMLWDPLKSGVGIWLKGAYCLMRWHGILF